MFNKWLIHKILYPFLTFSMLIYIYLLYVYFNWCQKYINLLMKNLILITIYKYSYKFIINQSNILILCELHYFDMIKIFLSNQRLQENIDYGD